MLDVDEVLAGADGVDADGEGDEGSLAYDAALVVEVRDAIFLLEVHGALSEGVFDVLTHGVQGVDGAVRGDRGEVERRLRGQRNKKYSAKVLVSGESRLEDWIRRRKPYHWRCGNFCPASRFMLLLGLGRLRRENSPCCLEGDATRMVEEARVAAVVLE